MPRRTKGRAFSLWQQPLFLCAHAASLSRFGSDHSRPLFWMRENDGPQDRNAQTSRVCLSRASKAGAAPTAPSHWIYWRIFAKILSTQLHRPRGIQTFNVGRFTRLQPLRLCWHELPIAS